VDLVRTEVSEKLIASIIRMERISVLGTKLAVTSNRSTLQSVVVGSVLQLPVTAKVAHCSPSLSTHDDVVFVPPIRRFLQELHGVTFQKTGIHLTKECSARGSLGTSSCSSL
jgi:hypothetical protein